MSKSVQITALTAEQLAQLLSQASRKAIASEDVHAIAEKGNILQPDGTINLIDYAAFLVSEVTHGRN